MAPGCDETTSATVGKPQACCAATPTIPPHPLGIKPLGNRYLVSKPQARECMGSLQALPDEMLMLVLEYLDARDLRICGYTCKFLYAFSHANELWKALVVRASEESFLDWHGSWRSTILGLPKERQVHLDCDNVFSDVLHRPFVCANVSLGQFCDKIPRRNQIKRLERLSYDEFAEKWSHTPFILTQEIKSWPVSRDWNLKMLNQRYGDVKFQAEAVDWPLAIYHKYMLDNDDESPLYLFDRMFAEKMRLQVGHQPGSAYWSPECFGPDLFEVLGEERPAHCWLIVGPQGSGSTFHQDPNGTSAWNAVIQGAKYWVMFPPSVQVPGVYVSKDKSEVTSPLSIAEWLLEFHHEARQLPQCVEGTCRQGEILHVPSGWWHLVVNLEPGIALTQNFVPKSHLADVLSFLRHRPEQVTGFRRDITDPYALFTDRLKHEHPGLLQQALSHGSRASAPMKRKWHDVVGPATDSVSESDRSGGFSFGFGDGL